MKENQSLPKIEELIKRAEELVKSDSSAEQCVVVWTKTGNQFYLLNHDIMSCSTKEEDAFLKILTDNKDTEIRRAVCMWKDFTIDMMSRHLSESLIDLNPANKETVVILRTAKGLQTKTLRSCIPQ